MYLIVINRNNEFGFLFNFEPIQLHELKCNLLNNRNQIVPIIIFEKNLLPER